MASIFSMLETPGSKESDSREKPHGRRTARALAPRPPDFHAGRCNASAVPLRILNLRLQFGPKKRWHFWRFLLSADGDCCNMPPNRAALNAEKSSRRVGQGTGSCCDRQ